MSFPLRTVVSIWLAGFVAAIAHAQATILYSTDFDTSTPAETYLDDTSFTYALTQSGAWETNDPYDSGTQNGQTDGRRVINTTGYSLSASDHLAYNGGFNGYRPGRTDVLVGHPVTNGVTGGPGATTYHFATTVDISSPNDPLVRDSFGFVFRHGTGTNIFAANAGPATDSMGTTLFKIAFAYDMSANGLRVSYSIGNGSLIPGSSYVIPYNSFYNYQVDVSTDSATRDLLNLTITDTQGHATSVLTNIVLPDGDASQIDEADLLWQLGSLVFDANGHPSTNSMFMRDYLVSAIPEPTSFALLVGGVAILGLRRRR